jgi:hypothetical protein
MHRRAAEFCVAGIEADDRSRDKGRIERFDHAVPILSRAAQGAGREDWLAVD